MLQAKQIVQSLLMHEINDEKMNLIVVGETSQIYAQFVVRSTWLVFCSLSTKHLCLTHVQYNVYCVQNDRCVQYNVDV